MPNKKKNNSKKKSPKKAQKPKNNENSSNRSNDTKGEEKDKVDLESLNQSIDSDSRELVEIVEIEGKGRGMVARKDISIGTEILKDAPLAASIYGIEIMPIKYHFKSWVNSIIQYDSSCTAF